MADGVVYLTQLTHSLCPGAQQTQAGPASPGIFWVASGGALRRTTVPGVTGDASSVQGALGARLLVLARASCTGPAELLWLSPVTGARQTLLSAPAGQAGVVAALPFNG